MKTSTLTRALTAGLALSTFAASADDAAALRKEIEQLTERLDRLEAPPAKTPWTDLLRIQGDLRYRYEYKAEDGDTDDNHHRLRARIGAYADVNDQIEAGVRIATGSSKGATSTNQTLGDDASKKQIWLDLAYFTYRPEAVEGLGVTFGKMKQPWTQVADLIFDSDVNPEGISAAYRHGEDLSLHAVFGYHLLDERQGDDVELISGQIATSAKLRERATLTLGTGAFVFNNIDRVEPIGYDLIDGFAALDLKHETLPVKLYGEFLRNVDAEADDADAWMVGMGTKYKKLKFDYNYRDLGADSVWDQLDDGDFGGPDGKGHKIKASYAFLKNCSAGVTYFRVDAANVDVDLVQADLAIKF